METRGQTHRLPLVTEQGPRESDLQEQREAMPRKARRGGAGGGGGARTEEERLQYQQQKAQAEEEMSRKKEEILTLFLKDKLHKEEKNTSVNLLKLNEGWRSILRQTRAAELRKDVDVLRQTFERQLDGLDDVIKTLGRDLQEAERQWMQVRRVHLQHVERLRAAQEEHVCTLQGQREENLQNLRTSFQGERNQIVTHSEHQRGQLEDAAFTLEQRHKRLMNDIITVYSESMASYESAHDDQMAALVLEGKMALTEKSQKMQEVLLLHREEEKDLEDLLLKKQRLVEKMEEKMKTAKKLQVAASQQQQKFKSSETQDQFVEQELRKAVDYVKVKTQTLRDQLIRGQSASRKRLIQLTLESDAATKRLQVVIDKGERVLRVGEICGKVEHVVPPSPWSADDHRSEPEEEKEPAVGFCAFPELRPAMRRINVALLHRDALKRDRERLRRENGQLRLLLRQRLDAMTVSESHLHAGPALLSIQQAPTTTTPMDISRHYTVVEAVHVVKNTL